MLSTQRIVSCTRAALAWTALVAQAGAADIPAQLSRPDGKPGDATKPLKVYLLAGQSNMVGMGDLGNARPLYPSVYLSADPAILPGRMPIGDAGLAAHGVYQSAAADGAPGAKVAVFRGAYDPNADYSQRTPAWTGSVSLGTVAAQLPTLDGPHTQVVSAFIDVPADGEYTVHAGFQESSCNVVTLDGKEVYRREIGGRPEITKVSLQAGKRHPVTITYFQGGSAAFWLEQVELVGRGDLVTLTKRNGAFPYLLDESGSWSVRQDVTYTDPRLFPARASSPLSATSNNGNSIGPEVGFGFVMGTFHDEQVLLIKTAQGNRSLGFDFRPPSSGRTDPDNEYEGLEYRLMVKGVRETLDRLDQVVPGYQGQGYEIAGFGWFQGHKDSGASKEEYETHLVHLIRDLRQEFQSPRLPVVVATVGFQGYGITDGPWRGVWEAQMAVGDPQQHPEFAGTVASVDTRDFWREVEESPRNQDYHYHRNPETYLLIGEAMGRALVRLGGGRAEAIPKSDREARRGARAAAQAAATTPSAAQQAASIAALQPIILDGALVKFVSNPQQRPSLLAALQGQRPARPPLYLDDTLDGAVDYYRVAGIRDYDWQLFGPDPMAASWAYHSVELPDPQARKRGISDLGLLAPAGLENWFATDFDVQRAGWSSGVGPFGVQGDEPPIPTPDWYGGAKRGEPRTAFRGDVLLMRRTFDLPSLRPGHRYRVRVGGSIHANSGEGFAIYLNGRLLAESKAGVVAWRREGGRPRGGHVWSEFRDEFQGGQVTIAVSNFPMDNRTDERFIPARAPLTVWLEEMRLPPLGDEPTSR